MRDHNEFCAEIQRRKIKLKEKKKQRERLLTCGAGALICIAVVATSPWKYITQPEIGGQSGENAPSYISNTEEDRKDAELTEEDVMAVQTNGELDDENREEMVPEETFMEACTDEDMESIKVPNVTVSGYMGNEYYLAPSAAEIIEILLSHEGVTLVNSNSSMPDGGATAPPDCFPETDAPDPVPPEMNNPEADAPEKDENLEPAPDATEITESYTEEIKEDAPPYFEEEVALEIKVMDDSGKMWIFNVNSENFDDIVDLIKNICN